LLKDLGPMAIWKRELTRLFRDDDEDEAPPDMIEGGGPLPPRMIDGMLDRALELHVSGDTDQAVRIYNRVLTQEPRNVRALNNLAVYEASRGAYDKATGYLELLIMNAPDDEIAKDNLEFAKIMQARQSKEGEETEAAPILVDEDAIDRILEKARTALDNERLDRAVRLYRRVLKIDEESVVAMNNLGAILGHRRRYEDAVGYFKRALELEPENQVARDNLTLAESRTRR
jgi:superkiller protein 3